MERVAEDDLREKALEAALRVATLSRCRSSSDTITDDILADAEKILAFLQPEVAELVFIVGPVTEQTEE